MNMYRKEDKSAHFDERIKVLEKVQKRNIIFQRFGDLFKLTKEKIGLLLMLLAIISAFASAHSATVNSDSYLGLFLVMAIVCGVSGAFILLDWYIEKF